MISEHYALELEEKLRTSTATVAVSGLGYVGLPLALALADRGFSVLGLDLREEKVAAVNGGRSYVNDVPSAAVARAVGAQLLRASTDPSVLSHADAVFICVPTPFTVQKEPDVSYVAEAARQVARWGQPGQLVILRSTSYPGTTEEVVRPILEATGRRVGDDVFLAFAPERVDPGNQQFGLADVPVVIGGCDSASTRLAALLLGRIARHIIPVSSPVAAEMTKMLENVFRNVNIALVNQIAQLCDRMGLDVWEVVEAAATKPYGFMSFKPGLVGGHCIPVDPYYLSWKAREFDFHMDFIELAARVNEAMPYYVVNKLITALHDNGINRRERVTILGVAFKRDVDDARHSPAVKIIELLKKRMIEVDYHDPYIPLLQVNGNSLRSQPLTAERLRRADCVLILTDHSCFDYGMIVRCARMVFDTRNATRNIGESRQKIIRL